MPSFVEQYIENPTGRTAMFSLIIASFIFLLTWLIPLSNPAEGDLFSFLYKDISLPEEDRERGLQRGQAYRSSRKYRSDRAYPHTLHQ